VAFGAVAGVGLLGVVQRLHNPGLCLGLVRSHRKHFHLVRVDLDRAAVINWRSELFDGLRRRRLRRLLVFQSITTRSSGTHQGAGAVSLVLLSAVVVLGVLSTLRFRERELASISDNRLHRNIASLRSCSSRSTSSRRSSIHSRILGWLPAVVPFSSYYRTVWLGLGTIAVELIVAVSVTSLVRGFHRPRRVAHHHWLSYASWPWPCFTASARGPTPGRCGCSFWISCASSRSRRRRAGCRLDLLIRSR